jgi:iron complex transport system substrate-binding protein
VKSARVVSLLPSATEIVCALGRQHQLVGRSHECDFPSGVSSLPVCTRALLPDGSSQEIDANVRDLVSRGLSLYDVDVDALRRLQPDIVLTQDQCQVCAVPLSDVEEALAECTGSEVHIVSLAPALLGDVWRDILRVGAALDARREARQLSAGLASRVSDVGERTGALSDRPSVVCLEWVDPLMAAGNWIPELVTIAGGRPLLGDTGCHSPRIEWSDLLSADPDVLVVTACGFDLDRSAREAEALREHPSWPRLRAVVAGRVFLTDGSAYFNRPGPRLVESLEILAEILHRNRFDFGHRGPGFRALSGVPESRGPKPA